MASKDVGAIAGAMQGAAKDVTNLIQSEWENSIAMFYGAYSPKQYKRTGNLYNASDRGANNYCSVSGNTITVQAGIIVDSSNMAELYENESASTVLGLAYGGGIHGSPEIAVTTPPQTVFEPWFNGMYGTFVQMILDAAGLGG